MKTLPITPKVADPLKNAFGISMNELHSYLRPDGLNAVIKPIVQKVKPQPIVQKVKPQPIVRQHAYFSPTTNIKNPTLNEDVGRNIDFRFG